MPFGVRNALRILIGRLDGFAGDDLTRFLGDLLGEAAEDSV